MKKIVKTLVSKVYVGINEAIYSFLPARLECNICHYKANRFNNNQWHKGCGCPKCSSTVRRRLVWASLTLLPEYHFSKLLNGKRVLHFAPERGLKDIVKAEAGDYKTADMFTEGYAYESIDYKIDISSMPEIPDGSFDCVIACDVLEHVPKHLDGLREVYRILSVGGVCIFTVPQKDNLKHTIEDLTIQDPKKRIELFGQFDHLRIYGDDFLDMLKDAGFSSVAIGKDYFPEDMIERFVLHPPMLSSNPLATNFRKVFIGSKQKNDNQPYLN